MLFLEPGVSPCVCVCVCVCACVCVGRARKRERERERERERKREKVRETEEKERERVCVYVYAFYFLRICRRGCEQSITFGHFWSLLVTFGHVWSLLVTFSSVCACARQSVAHSVGRKDSRCVSEFANDYPSSLHHFEQRDEVQQEQEQEHKTSSYIAVSVQHDDTIGRRAGIRTDDCRGKSMCSNSRDKMYLHHFTLRITMLPKKTHALF